MESRLFFSCRSALGGRSFRLGSVLDSGLLFRGRGEFLGIYVVWG